MDIVTFLNSLHAGRVQPIYVILGDQSYLIRLACRALVNLIPAKRRTMDYARYDLNSVPLKSVFDDADYEPFLGGKRRLVIATNANFLTGKAKANAGKRPKKDKKSQRRLNLLIKNYLKHPLKSTILVFLVTGQKLDNRKSVVKLMRNYATVVDLNRISVNQVRNYVDNQIQQRGYQISSNTLDALIQRTGGRLSSVMSELPKLFLYCEQDRTISTAAVDSLVTKSLDQNVFDLANDVLHHRATTAINFYHQLLLRGEPALKLNAILVGQFRRLLQVMILNRKGYSQGGLAKVLRQNPYAIKMTLRSLYRLKLKLSTLIRAYLGLVGIEIKLKSTRQSPELLFELFVLKFVN